MSFGDIEQRISVLENAIVRLNEQRTQHMLSMQPHNLEVHAGTATVRHHLTAMDEFVEAPAHTIVDSHSEDGIFVKKTSGIWVGVGYNKYFTNKEMSEVFPEIDVVRWGE